MQIVYLYLGAVARYESYGTPPPVLCNTRQSVTCSHAHSVRIWSSVKVPGWAPHMGRGRAGDVMAHVARRADEGPLPEA